MLRFELDEQRHWSLWYHGDGQPVPLVPNAAIGVGIGGQVVTLGDLEYSTVGNRRPPGGTSLIVRGRAAGVVLEAELFSSSVAAAPQAGVRVAVYPDRELPTMRTVRFLQASAADALPGNTDLVALVNGVDAPSECRIVTLSALPATGVVSYGAVGLTRGGRGLALAFDAEDPGSGTVRLSADGLEAASEWTPTRPLRPEGDVSRLRLCYVPDGDGLDALRALFAPTSVVDRERLAASVAPAGWCSGSELAAAVTEADVLANLEFCAARLDQRFCRYVELDDGYQRAVGDWEPNERFPHGHRWLTDQVHAKGLQAGLWLAPFAVAERSGVPTAHPEWILKGPDDTTPQLVETREDWGGGVYTLDGAHPGVRQWLFELARRAVREWGYDYLKLDLLARVENGGSHYGGVTHAEAFRGGLGALRDGAGTEAFLVGGDAPLQHAMGLVNAARIGPDVQASWSGLQGPARAAGLRSFYHRGAWLNDPGHLVVRPPLSPAEARLWTSILAVSGGVASLSDNLPALPADRIEILQRAIPVATGAGRPIGAVSEGSELGDLPAGAWIMEGAPRWWTVVLANWAEEAKEIQLPLAALGLASGRTTRYDTYDVWEGAPRADTTDGIGAKLEPHASLTIALRPAASRPQVIGSTRHVVQGAVDITNESWDATRRILTARSVNRDARAYAVTIAVPKGMRATACEADPTCALRRLESGHVILEWPAGDGADITWEVKFGASRAPERRTAAPRHTQ